MIDISDDNRNIAYFACYHLRIIFNKFKIRSTNRYDPEWCKLMRQSRCNTSYTTWYQHYDGSKCTDDTYYKSLAKSELHEKQIPYWTGLDVSQTQVIVCSETKNLLYIQSEKKTSLGRALIAQEIAKLIVAFEDFQSTRRRKQISQKIQSTINTVKILAIEHNIDSIYVSKPLETLLEKIQYEKEWKAGDKHPTYVNFRYPPILPMPTFSPQDGESKEELRARTINFIQSQVHLIDEYLSSRRDGDLFSPFRNKFLTKKKVKTMEGLREVYIKQLTNLKNETISPTVICNELAKATTKAVKTNVDHVKNKQYGIFSGSDGANATYIALFNGKKQYINNVNTLFSCTAKHNNSECNDLLIEEGANYCTI